MDRDSLELLLKDENVSNEEKTKAISQEYNKAMFKLGYYTGYVSFLEKIYDKYNSK